MRKDNALFIVFGAQKEYINYELSNGEMLAANNYSFTEFGRIVENKQGEIMTVNQAAKMGDFLPKYLSKMRYEVIFTFDHSNGRYSEFPLNQVEPLISNRDGEVVSFFSGLSSHKFFVFPCLNSLHEFLPAFLQQIAPLYVPDLFPGYDGKKWLQDKPYYLPGHENLLAEKKKILQEYQVKMTQMDGQLEQNSARHYFLGEILTATGEDLVKSIKQLLEEFGFDNVEFADDGKSSGFEEDLDITDNGKTLLIEVKGVNGTSKDEDCSQIYKVVNRRRKEKKDFEIYGLYIVNHQRSFPPLKRNNPPFTPHQIADAVTDERGLLTTWQLFNLYFDYQEGIISIDQIKKQFYKVGYIQFDYPNLVEVGMVTEIFQNGKIAILTPKVEIAVKSCLYFLREDRHIKTEVVSIKRDDQTVASAKDFEAGIKLTVPVKVGTKLFIYQLLGQKAFQIS